MKLKFEYIWLDGYTPEPNLRSKTKVIESYTFFDEKTPSVEELPVWSYDGSSTKQREPCSPQESILLEHIDLEPADIDQLANCTGLSAADISALLISLELKGYIEISELGYTKKVYK